MLLPLRSLFVALNRTRNYKILHESPSGLPAIGKLRHPLWRIG
jgi:hypothetical protein